MAMTDYAPAGWREAGACASADPDLFFPISAGGKATAQIARAQRQSTARRRARGIQAA
jgi:hypothetical protein